VRLKLIAFVRAGVIGLALGGLGWLATGCAFEATPAVYAEPDYGYYAVDTVPADIGLSPRVYYRGNYAYWVGGRWLYPGPRGWVTFRSEPAELYRYRMQPSVRPYYGVTPQYRTPYYGSPGPVYRAPPASRSPYRYQAPRARPPTYQAPPARPPTYRAPRARPPTYHAPPAHRGR
jgi:hypothetical protein